MRIDGLFKDRFLKREIFISIIVVSLIIFFSILYMNNKLQEYHGKEIIRYANVIGAIESNIKVNEDLIPYIVDNEWKEEYVEIGLSKLGEYGYFKDMNIENKWIGTSFVDARNSMIVMGTSFVFLTLVIMLIVLYRLFRKINKVSESLNDLSSGKRFEKLNDREEGAIGILYHRYNMTVSRMNNWIDEIDCERKVIKELLNDLSHQLKTPIASIKMNTELILDGYTDERETFEFLENNKENIERMQWITEGLLQLSSLESQCIKINRKEENLNKTLIGAINSIYGKAIGKNITLEVFNEEEVKIFHDRKWTKEAIINIVDNAIKYSDNGESIKIELRDYQHKSEIIIEDSGYGIKEEDLKNIFKRFYRSSQDNVREEEGSGIGLYLSKKIIESQDGVIQVKSTLGEGSKFTIIVYKHIIN